MDIKEVVAVAEEALKETDMFVVDYSITPDNTIELILDSDTSVSIDTCAMLNHAIGEKFNRDEEDYELEVGSAGLGQPFKVEQQYINCIGEEVEVMPKDGKKVTGTLKSVDAPHFTVTIREKKRLEGQKRPQMVETDVTFDMEEVKYTKYVLNFK